MSDSRLSVEAARRRLQLREEEARHAVTRAALRDANRLLLRLALRDRLRNPDDFVIYIGGLDVLLDDVGRIDWGRVERLLGVILEQRPHFATPNAANAAPLHVDAVSSLSTESGLAIDTDSAQEAQGATRIGPGAGADGDTHPTESQ